jgi:hypothetical protein
MTENPAVETAEDEFAISPQWEARRDYKKPFKHRLEKSNQNLLLQHLDMPDLMKMGIANEVDFMTKALMSTPGDDKKEASASDQIDAAIKLGANFSKLETMINKVVTAGIIKPKVYFPPEHENARQKGLFYVDYISWDERQDLFGVIFDSEGLSDFREEQEHGVGDVANVEDVQLPTEQPVADVRSENPEGVLL